MTQSNLDRFLNADAHFIIERSGTQEILGRKDVYIEKDGTVHLYEDV